MSRRIHFKQAEEGARPPAADALAFDVPSIIEDPDRRFGDDVLCRVEEFSRVLFRREKSDARKLDFRSRNARV